MHIALAVDHDRLRVEHDWFSRTVVGLLAGGNQVVRLLPRAAPDDPRLSLAPALRLPGRVVPWLGTSAWDRAADALLERSIDVIHVFGSSLWSTAFQIASRNRTPLLLDVRSPREAHALAHWKHRGDTRTPIAFTTATPALARYLSGLIHRPQATDSAAGAGFIHHVPVGVHLPDSPEPILTRLPDHAAALIAARGASWNRLKPALEGAADALHRFSMLLLFLDCDDALSSSAWKLARTFSLLDRLTLIPSIEQHRRGLLSADLVLLPDPLGRASTFPLEVMAAGIPLLALANEFTDFSVSLEPGHRPIPPPSRATDSRRAWADAITEVLAMPEQARLRGAATRRWVHTAHSMTAQLNGLFSVYSRLTGGLLLDSVVR